MTNYLVITTATCLACITVGHNLDTMFMKFVIYNFSSWKGMQHLHILFQSNHLPWSYSFRRRNEIRWLVQNNKFIGPQDSPKATKKDWIDEVFQLVPNACLYTIVPRPNQSGSPGDVAFYMPVYSCLYFYCAVTLYCHYNQWY